MSVPNQASEALLKVSGVETYYGNIRALGGVTIDVKRITSPAFAEMLKSPL